MLVSDSVTISEMAQLVGLNTNKTRRIIIKLELPLIRKGYFLLIDRRYRGQIKHEAKTLKRGRPLGAKNKPKL
ncbi:MAG: hypothetical protein ILNGONEN_00792 [Syntrophorhabdaceae bacterium]|jgi:hypothetical protein|nr:hypothetical protein [Syntrophorhabdaceae bacterium]